MRTSQYVIDAQGCRRFRRKLTSPPLIPLEKEAAFNADGCLVSERMLAFGFAFTGSASVIFSARRVFGVRHTIFAFGPPQKSAAAATPGKLLSAHESRLLATRRRALFWRGLLVMRQRRNKVSTRLHAVLCQWRGYSFSVRARHAMETSDDARFPLVGASSHPEGLRFHR